MKPLSAATRLAGAVSLFAMLGCGAEEGPAGPVMESAAGAKGPGITVSSADPAYGYQGDVQKQVRIRGSGFEPGDQAAWQRGGVTDPEIQVVSTAFVSSSELVATINIGTGAALAFYDIAIVRPGRKGGIGTMMFEVTTIELLPEFAGQDGQAMDINDGGDIVGYSNLRAVRWASLSILEDLGPGSANAIDAASTRVVGTTSLDLGASQASLWSGSPGNWVRTLLPTVCAGGTVTTSMGSAVSGNGTFAGGWLRVQTGGRKSGTVLRAVRWNLAASTCTLLVDPPGGFAPTVKGINDLGMATGHGVFWDENGNGVNLPPWPGESAAYSYALTEDGTIVVGRAGARAVYWRKISGAWSQPIELPSGSPCQSGNQGQANDITATGDLIVGIGCDGGAWYWQLSNGVLTSSTRLTGLGPQGNGAAQAVRNVATSGAAWIVGGAKGQPVYWPH